tara:strand:- start:1121 stop:1288 length:168 start_codon:yes stop_codon:yes gene_type:complete
MRKKYNDLLFFQKVTPSEFKEEIERRQNKSKNYSKKKNKKCYVCPSKDIWSYRKD